MITLNHSDIFSTSNVAGLNRVEKNLPQEASKESLYRSGVAAVDTVSISSAARDMANGKVTETVQHTYENLAAVGQINQGHIISPIVPEPAITEVELRGKPEIAIENFFDNAMKNILDNRMGIDKEKLKEIEAMMEEVAKDDSLSPEQKAKKLEELQKLMDKVIEESVEKLKNQQT